MTNNSSESNKNPDGGFNKNMTTDTPRTDAAYKDHEWDMIDHIPLEFARQLERELAVSLENQLKTHIEVERLKELLNVPLFISADGTITPFTPPKTK